MPLIVCPTPIGNDRDLPPRVLDELAAAELIAAEDTRTTRRLLAHHGIEAKPLVSVHDHNEEQRTPQIVEAAATQRVALVSEAGMPALNDPGFRVIRACAQAGVEVVVLPGPSAILVAIVASGLPTDRWRFCGYVPRTRAGREELFASRETVVAFESPRRLRDTLEAIPPDRPVAVCRELTKTHEEIVRGTAAEVLAAFTDHEPLGEIVLVVAGAEGGGDLAAAVALLDGVVEAGARPRPAAAAVAAALGVAKNDVYRAWLDR